MTGVELELITDYNKYLFFGKAIRGGIIMVIKRYSKANNPMVSNYDPEKPNSWILYLDANSLYCRPMSQRLPTGVFRWFGNDEIRTFDVQRVADDSEKDCVLEMNLEYRRELHHYHNAYSLVPERLRLCTE